MNLYRQFYVWLVGILLLGWVSCGYEPYTQGKQLYQSFCANCHMDNGEGLRGLYPPLAQSDYLKEHQSEIACFIRYGVKGKILVNGKEYNQPMAGIKALNEVEINNIVNYIFHAWGNDLGNSKVSDIKTSLENCDNQP